MKKKKIIILILPIKLRQIDLDRYDVKELEKISKAKFEIHEIVNFLYPGFEKAFLNTIKDKRLKSFDSFNLWKKDFNKILKKYNEILVIKNVHSDTLTCLRLNLFLQKNKKIKVLEFSSLQSPINVKKNFLKQIKILFFTAIFNPKKILVHIKRKPFNYLSKIFNIEPNFIIKTGKKFNNIHKTAKIISGNSFDYNMYLKTKPKSISKKNYGLFLEAPSPLYLGDSYFDGVKLKDLGTPEKWFKSLNNFFNLIEKYKKIKIKIVAHPKVKHYSKYPSYYFGREVLTNRLPEVAKNSKIFISRDSVGSSFAAIYNKPVVFIYTDEFKEKKNNFLENQNYIADSFGTKAINIDNEFSQKNINNLFNFKKNKYKEYIENYLSERKDKKNNYKILNELLK